MPGPPGAFLWPRLPATTPYLGPRLGLGIALEAQSEEGGQVHEAGVREPGRSVLPWGSQAGGTMMMGCLRPSRELGEQGAG